MEILQQNPIYKPKITLKLFRPSMIDKASKENAEVEMTQNVENTPQENADAGDKANRAKILS
jgi:hypothetical protein